MSGGNYVTLDKVNFRPYIRPYLEKNQDIKSSYLFEFFQLPIEPLQFLTLSWRRSLSYRNQSNDLRSKVQSCKLYNHKYMIDSIPITNTETFAFITSSFKLLSRKVLLRLLYFMIISLLSYSAFIFAFYCLYVTFGCNLFNILTFYFCPLQPLHICLLSQFSLETHRLTLRHKIVMVNWYLRQFSYFDSMKDTFQIYI